jgi:hypothetical protein
MSRGKADLYRLALVCYRLFLLRFSFLEWAGRKTAVILELDRLIPAHKSVIRPQNMLLPAYLEIALQSIWPRPLSLAPLSFRSAAAPAALL